MNQTIVEKCDHEINTIQYSPHFKNVFACGSFDDENWYHGGYLYVFHVKHHGSKCHLEKMAKYDNKTGINEICWSEKDVQNVACANHDGSFTVWNVNEGRKWCTVQSEKGNHPLSSVDWNQFLPRTVLVGSTSSRIQMYDLYNANSSIAIFPEHTKAIYNVKWNPNNQNEFCSVSRDGLVKIWDKRNRDNESVNTLLDRSVSQKGCFTTSCDWHKQDDWYLLVGNSLGQCLLWDTRNALQPVLRRYSHGDKITSVKFDTTNVNRIATCSVQCDVRIWRLDGIKLFLSQEHKFHKERVTCIDWDIHSPHFMTSVSQDKHIIHLPIESMTQVKESIKNNSLIAEKQPPILKSKL